MALTGLFQHRHTLEYERLFPEGDPEQVAAAAATGATPDAKPTAPPSSKPS